MSRRFPWGTLQDAYSPPRRRTPIHEWHTQRDAKFMHAGAWLRPAYYRVTGRSPDACIAEEALCVRHAAGLVDVGTLGKLELSGPDAVALLERTYTGEYAGLLIGACRYGLMCDESGVVIDDGVVARLGDESFYVTTTSGGADGVFREMQRNALVWGLDVRIVNATTRLLRHESRRSKIGGSTVGSHHHRLGGCRFPAHGLPGKGS